jgi:hypothetical protein
MEETPYLAKESAPGRQFHHAGTLLHSTLNNVGHLKALSIVYIDSQLVGSADNHVIMQILPIR